MTYKAIMRPTLLLTLLFYISGILAGCTGENHSFDWKKPVSLDMNPPEGPENYRTGWVHGCRSALSSSNTSMHLAFGSYQFVIDKTRQKEPLYAKAWRYGYNHCGYSMKSLAQYAF